MKMTKVPRPGTLEDVLQKIQVLRDVDHCVEIRVVRRGRDVEILFCELGTKHRGRHRNGRRWWT
jgi:hypothetical protein